MLSSIEDNIVHTVWYKKFFDASKNLLLDDYIRIIRDCKINYFD